MTDKLHYPDLFKTINISKPERRLAMKAKNLFDIVHGKEPWDAHVFAHISKLQEPVDTESASQIFWNYENDKAHTYDRLALTAIYHTLIIALEHRDFDHREQGIRKTLTLSYGHPSTYVTDIVGNGRVRNIPTPELTVESFKRDFYGVSVANLGLAGHIKRMQATQNESSSAIFESAA